MPATKEQVLKEFVEIRKKYYKETGSYDITRSYYTKNSKYGYRYKRLGFTFQSLKNQQPLKIKNKVTSFTRIKRFIVSCIIPRAEVNTRFFNALLRYRLENNAELILIPIKGVNGEVHFENQILQEYSKYFKYDFIFNKKLSILNLGFTANNNPVLSTLQRRLHTEQSYILPCTKQKMEISPRIDNNVNLIYTTGTICKPVYKNNQTGFFNDINNTFGALVVEVYNETDFNIRNLRWINGCFVDLDKMYCFDKTMRVRPTALVAGDLHLGGDEDKNALKCTKEQIKFLKPKMLVVHDLASHNSINRHTKESMLSRAKFVQQTNLLTLEQEHQYIAKFILDYSKDIPDVVWKIVASNHNEWLKKYLDSPQSWYDIYNQVYNTQLKQNFFMQNYDVFASAINYQLYKLKKPRNLKIDFLTRKDHLIVGGYELAYHGDKGIAGSKGSLATHELSARKCVIGHSHSPKVGEVAYQVGTNSKLELNYTAGSGNNWAHANCAVYNELEQVQMILTLNGRWK